ncbi:hypothetical protein THAOC_24843, partial [Thalassiosira oceanica]
GRWGTSPRGGGRRRLRGQAEPRGERRAVGPGRGQLPDPPAAHRGQVGARVRAGPVVDLPGRGPLPPEGTRLAPRRGLAVGMGPVRPFHRRDHVPGLPRQSVRRVRRAGFQAESLDLAAERGREKPPGETAGPGGDDDGGDPPAIALVRRLSLRNQTLCIAGDSIDKQLYAALHRLLVRQGNLPGRHGYTVKTSGRIVEVNYTAISPTLGWVKGWMVMNDIPERTFTVWGPEGEVFGATVRFIKTYAWTPWNTLFMDECGIITLNLGLHYKATGSMTEHYYGGNNRLENDMTASLSYLADFVSTRPNRQVVWRRTFHRRHDVLRSTPRARQRRPHPELQQGVRARLLGELQRRRPGLHAVSEAARQNLHPASEGHRHKVGLPIPFREQPHRPAGQVRGERRVQRQGAQVGHRGPLRRAALAR